ncbi:MAG: DUF4345 domain-containing protein [Arenimonas sp.]|nr:DUF4345 domain-containing protein [Rhizobium sp.]MBW8446057.1 DUF4345 domain-containing protein [Arenimonas sp.]
MEFYFPTEFGEQLAFGAAAFAALIGALAMFAPGLTLKCFALEPRNLRPEGFGAVRSAGGLAIGYSATALMLAQPTLYLAFGAAMALAAFGQILSIMSDRGTTLRNMLLLVVELILAAMPLSYVFGLL